MFDEQPGKPKKSQRSGNSAPWEDDEEAGAPMALNQEIAHEVPEVRQSQEQRISEVESQLIM